MSAVYAVKRSNHRPDEVLDTRVHALEYNVGDAHVPPRWFFGPTLCNQAREFYDPAEVPVDCLECIARLS